VDVKIPLFPTTSTRESFELLRTLCKKRGLALHENDFFPVENNVPLLLTPGAAEALAVKIYRQVRTSGSMPLDALRASLSDYQNPVPAENPRIPNPPGRQREQRFGFRSARLPQRPRPGAAGIGCSISAC
jgi:hypothetical protein